MYDAKDFGKRAEKKLSQNIDYIIAKIEEEIDGRRLYGFYE